MSDCDVINSPPARLENFVACVRRGTTWYDAIVGRVNVPYALRHFVAQSSLPWADVKHSVNSVGQTIEYLLPTHAYSGAGVEVHRRSSVYPHDISKNDATRIIKLDIEMTHHESGEPIYFMVKRSKVKFTRHKNSADVDFSTLLSSGVL